MNGLTEGLAYISRIGKDSIADISTLSVEPLTVNDWDIIVQFSFFQFIPSLHGPLEFKCWLS